MEPDISLRSLLGKQDQLDEIGQCDYWIHVIPVARNNSRRSAHRFEQRIVCNVVYKIRKRRSGLRSRLSLRRPECVSLSDDQGMNASHPMSILN